MLPSPNFDIDDEIDNSSDNIGETSESDLDGNWMMNE